MVDNPRNCSRYSMRNSLHVGKPLRFFDGSCAEGAELNGLRGRQQYIYIYIYIYMIYIYIYIPIPPGRAATGHFLVPNTGYRYYE